VRKRKQRELETRRAPKIEARRGQVPREGRRMEGLRPGGTSRAILQISSSRVLQRKVQRGRRRAGHCRSEPTSPPSSSITVLLTLSASSLSSDHHVCSICYGRNLLRCWHRLRSCEGGRSTQREEEAARGFHFRVSRYLPSPTFYSYRLELRSLTCSSTASFSLDLSVERS